MDRGVGTPARYAECFQWFLAPTDRAGRRPDPDRAPSDGPNMVPLREFEALLKTLMEFDALSKRTTKNPARQ